MIKNLVLALTLILSSCSEKGSNQTYTEDIVYRTKGQSFQNYYVEIVPDNEIKGLLVLNHGFGMSPEKFLLEMRLDNLAAQHGILTIAPTLKNWESTYLDKATLDTLDKVINEVSKKYKLQGKKFIIGGFSMGGTGALNYAENLLTDPSKSPLKLAGVFLVDSPIDLERLWESFNRELEKNPSSSEANYFVNAMKTNLGEFTTDNYDTYKSFSPFLASEQDGGRLSLIKTLPIRFYTEPDTIWWKKERDIEPQDINANDLEKAMVKLKEMGNKEAELIKTTNKGFRKDGTRHPHSWSIVDERNLLGWIENKIVN